MAKRKIVDKEQRNAIAGPGPSSSSNSPTRKKPKQRSEEVVDDDEVTEIIDASEDATWTCPQCSRMLPVPSTSSPPDPAADLQRVQDEHQDWHVAKSLQDETMGTVVSSTSSVGPSSLSVSPTQELMQTCPFVLQKREGIGKSSSASTKKKGTASKQKKSGSDAPGGGLSGWLLKK